MNKDTSVIPKGLYCEEKKGVCPYWGLTGNRPNQENGYCAYLEKSDWDLNEDAGSIEIFSARAFLGFRSAHFIKFSMLWDGIKECGINDTA